MTEEFKEKEPFEDIDEITDEDLAEENDKEIENYIREVTGRPTLENEEEDKQEPEVEHFRVTTQIGEDDHKAFILYSTLMRRKWFLPACIIVPIILAVMFAFDNGEFYSGNLIVALLVLYAALALIIVFRCRRWLSKVRKNNPQSLHLTDTTIIFLTNSIIHLKNEKRSKVEYYHLVELGETKKRFYMYFDSGKTMVFRKEDMPQDVFEEFKAFIKTKVHKKSFKRG